jgi:hypothetical protein
MENKKYFSLTLILCSTLFFLIGYLTGIGIDSENKQVKRQEFSIDVSGFRVDNKEALDKVIQKDSEILFEIQSTSNNFIIERTRTADEEALVGRTGRELEEKYKQYEYVLKNVTSNKIELVRKPIVYKPNRYILFTHNNEIVIARSDEKGSIFDKNGNLLSKEGTGTKFTSLRNMDIDNIVKGHESMQFESIEQLNDGIKDFDIKYEMPE